MSERFFETPETNVKMAALNLLRYKALRELKKSDSDWVLDIEDVNEVLLTAGLPVIIPEELKSKELEVM